MVRVQRVALVSGVAIVVIALAVMFTGSVVLLDLQREVASAQVVDGFGKRQHLLDVGIAYLGVPKLEGTIEIKCADGKVIQRGYVTPHMPSWQRMGKKGECTTIYQFNAAAHRRKLTLAFQPMQTFAEIA